VNANGIGVAALGDGDRVTYGILQEIGEQILAVPYGTSPPPAGS
jgi:hypothetical protein